MMVIYISIIFIVSHEMERVKLLIAKEDIGLALQQKIDTCRNDNGDM